MKKLRIRLKKIRKIYICPQLLMRFIMKKIIIIRHRTNGKKIKKIKLIKLKMMIKHYGKRKKIKIKKNK